MASVTVVKTTLTASDGDGSDLHYLLVVSKFINYLEGVEEHVWRLVAAVIVSVAQSVNSWVWTSNRIVVFKLEPEFLMGSVLLLGVLVVGVHQA